MNRHRTLAATAVAFAVVGTLATGVVATAASAAAPSRQAGVLPFTQPDRVCASWSDDAGVRHYLCYDLPGFIPQL